MKVVGLQALSTFTSLISRPPQFAHTYGDRIAVTVPRHTPDHAKRLRLSACPATLGSGWITTEGNERSLCESDRAVPRQDSCVSES